MCTKNVFWSTTDPMKQFQLGKGPSVLLSQHKNSRKRLSLVSVVSCVGSVLDLLDHLQHIRKVMDFQISPGNLDSTIQPKSSLMNKFCVVLGTRPEIIKLSGIIKCLEAAKKGFFIIHTNQHYTEQLDAVFFQELKLVKPKYNLGVGSATPGAQTGKMLALTEEVLMQDYPDIVIVHGDTNSALAGALAAGKLNIPVAHVEAGLRSYDRTMPEELNRILVDHTANYLFAPTLAAKTILLGEGISGEKILVTGNTIVDAVFDNLQTAEDKSGILSELGLQCNSYILLTTHRTENTQSRKCLEGIVHGALLVCQALHKRVIFPVHPKTKKALENLNITIPENICLIEPVGFLTFWFWRKCTSHLD